MTVREMLDWINGRVAAGDVDLDAEVAVCVAGERHEAGPYPATLVSPNPTDNVLHVFARAEDLQQA